MIALFTLAATLFCAALLPAQQTRELAVIWPSPEEPNWSALRQLKADCVVIPLSGQRPPGAAGLKLIAELRPNRRGMSWSGVSSPPGAWDSTAWRSPPQAT